MEQTKPNIIAALGIFLIGVVIGVMVMLSISEKIITKEPIKPTITITIENEVVDQT